MLRAAKLSCAASPTNAVFRMVPVRMVYSSPEADLLSGVETPVADLAKWSKKLAPFIQSVAMMVNSTELASCPSGSGSLRRHRVLA